MDNHIVYIVDDIKEVRDSIVLLMESIGQGVESFKNANEFLERYNENLTGCLLIDVRMPGISGLELHQRLIEMRCKLPIIMISGHGDIAMAVKAIQAGAIEFIEKPFNEQELLDTIHRAFKLDDTQRGIDIKTGEIIKKIDTLTPREKEVFHAISAGKRNKLIAKEMHISQSTVESHRANVMEKMAAKSLSELMRMAVYVEVSSDIRDL